MAYRCIGALSGAHPRDWPQGRHYGFSGRAPRPPLIGRERCLVVFALFQPEHYAYIGRQIRIANHRVVVVDVVAHVIAYRAIDGGLAAAEHPRQCCDCISSSV